MYNLKHGIKLILQPYSQPYMIIFQEHYISTNVSQLQCHLYKSNKRISILY